MTPGQIDNELARLENERRFWLLRDEFEKARRAYLQAQKLRKKKDKKK